MIALLVSKYEYDLYIYIWVAFMGNIYSTIIQRRTIAIAKSLFRPIHGCQDQVICMRQLTDAL